MRDELLRILRKNGWSYEDLDDLRVIFDGELGERLFGESPDIVEFALKDLAFGKGSERKRIERVSKMLGIPPDILRRFFSVLRGRRSRNVEEDELPFPDLIDKVKRLQPWKLYEDLLEDLRVAADLSSTFDFHLSLIAHPYVYRVVRSRKTTPLILDGNNFLWKNDLDVLSIKELFLKLSEMKRTFYPVYMIFDANVEHIVPSSGRKLLKDLLSSKYSYKHSPADELIISMARDKRAVVMSEDNFREYGFNGERIGYPR